MTTKAKNRVVKKRKKLTTEQQLKILANLKLMDIPKEKKWLFKIIGPAMKDVAKMFLRKEKVKKKK